MSKKTLQKILDTLYHSYNGADGDMFATSDAKAAIKALFMEVIGEPSGLVYDSLPPLYDDPVEQFKNELRKAVGEL